MVRTIVLPLLAALVLGGCELSSNLGRSFSDDDEAAGARSCDGVVCGPCPPAITVRVTGADDNPMPEATLYGIDGSCGPDGAVTVCSTNVHAPGDYKFQVQAPGYQPASLEVMVPEMLVVGACCNCGYDAMVANVTLHRL